MPASKTRSQKPLTYSEALADDDYEGEFPPIQTKFLCQEKVGKFSFTVETVAETALREKFRVTCTSEEGATAECLCVSVPKAKTKLMAILSGEEEDDTEDDDE